MSSLSWYREQESKNDSGMKAFTLPQYAFKYFYHFVPCSPNNMDEDHELTEFNTPAYGKFVPSIPVRVATERNPAYGHWLEGDEEEEEEEEKEENSVYETIPYNQPGH